jgi:beta-glucanase (GH16 family)
VQQPLGLEPGQPRRYYERRSGSSALLTVGVILAILVSSFIAAEISRGQSAQPNGQTMFKTQTSPATPGPTSSSKIVILPSATASATPGAAPAAGAAARWRLVWSDEFSGPAGSAPDPSRWGHDVGGGGWGNSELEYYTASTANSALDGAGHLVITARSAAGSGLACWYGPCRYTSARLVTSGRFSQAYGRISARIKLPQGSGLWPSFWAVGDNIASVGWPQSGQLSILSNVGSAPGTVSGGLVGPGLNAWSPDRLSGAAFAAGYHTFTADWYPDHVSFLVDGGIYASQYRAAAGPGWVFDHPFFLILNLAVGGDLPGSPGPGTTFPQQLLVDWVRVYQAAPPAAAATGPVTGLAGKCAQAGPGGAVQLASCDNSAAQTWTIGTDGTIRAQGQCLDLAAAGTANGTAAQLADCTGAASQVWQAQTNGQLANPNSGRCLDVTNNNSADLTPLQIWDCGGAPNQLWQLP